MSALAEIIRLLKEAQGEYYDQCIRRGSRPVMAYLMTRRMGGYL